MILTILGVLLVIEGLPYFAFPRKTKQWALQIQEIPERNLRVMGLVSMAAGLLLLYVVSFFK
jgi:hypothetical protein